MRVTPSTLHTVIAPRRASAVLLIAIVMASVAALLTPTSARADMPAPKSEIVSRVLSDMNALRSTSGVSFANRHVTVAAAADDWALALAGAGGSTLPFPTMLATNLLVVSGVKADGIAYTDVVDRWAADPQSRRSIVANPSAMIGVGVAEGKDGVLHIAAYIAVAGPVRVPPPYYDYDPELSGYWIDHGQGSGTIGLPATSGSYWTMGSWGRVRYQGYGGGQIVKHLESGSIGFVPYGPLYDAWNAIGTEKLGPPSGDERCVSGLRCALPFLGGILTSTPEYGIHPLWGGIRDYWTAQGGITGALGPAVNDASWFSTPTSVAWQQNFIGGIVVQSSVGGVQTIPYSPVLRYWLASGGGAGWLGWPTGAYTCGPTGCSQPFSSGAVLGSGYYGAQPVTGGFVAEWARRGGVQGELGAPLGGLRQSSFPSLGWAQSFAGGIVVQSSAGFVVIPWGRIQGFWSATGESSNYGWPLSDRTCDTRNWCAQSFTYGIISESAYGVFGTSGGIGQFYKAQPNSLTTIGPALSSVRYGPSGGGGWQQNFAGGIITQSPAGMFFTPYGRILDVWAYYGAERTWLGWPAGEQTCKSDGSCSQKFQGGVARFDPNVGVSFSRS